MKIQVAAAAVLVVSILSGCASVRQGPVPFAGAKVATASTRVGVAMAVVPPVNTAFPGAGCLLCLAFANGMNSALTTHTQALPATELKEIKRDIADLLRKRGAVVKVIDEDLAIEDLPAVKSDAPDVARRDYSSYRARYDIDKLVVISVTFIGMQRTYSSYIPTSEPKAYIEGSGFIVNLADNTYEWFAPIRTMRAANGPWDEPPQFPGLTNAYYQAIESTKDDIRKVFVE